MSYHYDGKTTFAGTLRFFRNMIHGILHLFLTLRVQSTSGFIQYKDFRLLDESTGNSYALFLSTRKI